MRRVGTGIGGRAFNTICAAPLATARPFVRVSLGAVQRAFVPFPVRSFTGSALLQQDAAAKNIPVRWAGPTAPIARGVQGHGLLSNARNCLRRAPFEEAATLRFVVYGQLRWKSDAPRIRDETSKDAARQASDQPKPTLDPTTTTQKLYSQLPHLPHRPSKEELLSAATGFWHRLQLRFKWSTIRSARPFNADEIGAFLSWIFWGHFLWLLIGTTTFVSLAIFAVNTVFAQETLAGWVGEYLTRSSGVKIVFESAIVPTWREGVITFANVFVSRRPGTGRLGGRERAVSKGSSTTAAAAAQAAALASEGREGRGGAEDDDGNYTQFDLTISTVHVTLSFAKWFNGRGLLNSVEVHGVRGVLDRTHVQPIPEHLKRDPKSYRHAHNLGDFEIDAFRMEDVLLTVYQPRGFRPFQVSVYNCELPRLRKQWLFWDFMCANNMSGSFDESLFTIHPRQVHSTHGTRVDGQVDGGAPGQWKKHSRLRIDGLNIDHLNRGVEGPFSWIQEGNVDVVADVMIPHDEDGGIAKVIGGLYDQLETTISNASHQLPGSQQRTVAKRGEEEEGDSAIIRHTDDDLDEPTQQPLSPTAQPPPVDEESDQPLILDLTVHLNDVRASVPLFPREISTYNAALTRPIVAYINSRHTSIPITCRITKSRSEFDGSWTVFDSGLMEDLSRETYQAFVKDIHDHRQQRRRMRKVGGWAVGVLVRALVLGLAGQLA